MATLRIIGMVIMFSGLALKIADVPGYTPAFIAGAALLLFSRFWMWRNSSRETH